MAELQTGYVVIGDHQRFPGYSLFLCKEHAHELHELPRDFKLLHLEEMSLAAEAVYNAFSPEKLNYELLGQGEAHMHWHLFPRRSGDTPETGSVWRLPSQELYAEHYRPHPFALKELVRRLRTELERLVPLVK